MAYESNFDLDDFELYKLARCFRKNTYLVINKLPAEEKYCLGSQMRRAAVSVTNNIAEGHSRWYYQENIRFCRIARGSVSELIDDFNVCIDENYASLEQIETLKQDARQLIARINSYLNYLSRTHRQSKY